MFSVDWRSHVIHHMMTPWFVSAPKSYAIGKTLKMCLIDSTPWVRLNWMRSCAGVTWVTRGNQRLLGRKKQWGVMVKVMDFNVKASSRAKCRCQLIVRLKTIEYKEDISRYLSSSLNLLNYRPSRLAPAGANLLTSLALDFFFKLLTLEPQYLISVLVLLAM